MFWNFKLYTLFMKTFLIATSQPYPGCRQEIDLCHILTSKIHLTLDSPVSNVITAQLIFSKPLSDYHIIKAWIMQQLFFRMASSLWTGFSPSCTGGRALLLGILALLKGKLRYKGTLHTASLVSFACLHAQFGNVCISPQLKFQISQLSRTHEN